MQKYDVKATWVVIRGHNKNINDSPSFQKQEHIFPKNFIRYEVISHV